MNPWVLVFVGWVLSGLLFGMWFGERMRRLDAQYREGRLPLSPKEKATIRDARTGEDRSHELEENQVDEDRILKSLIKDAVADGLSEKQAREEAMVLLREMRKLGL